MDQDLRSLARERGDVNEGARLLASRLRAGELELALEARMVDEEVCARLSRVCEDPRAAMPEALARELLPWVLGEADPLRSRHAS